MTNGAVGQVLHAKNIPVPDPSDKTVEAIAEAVATTRAMLASHMITSDLFINQRFATVDNQFSVVERHRVEQKQDTKTAVDAALAAQKEAATKAETDTNRKLDQIQVSVTTPIADLKERITRIESMGVGGNEMKASMIAGMIGVSVLVSTVIGVIAFMAGSK